MDNKTLKSVTASALSAFTSYHMLDGLDALAALAADLMSDSILDGVTRLSDDYRRMLTYLSEQGNDDQHHNVQHTILSEGIRLTLRAAREIRLLNADDTYAKAFEFLSNTYGKDFTQPVISKWQSLLTPEETAETQDDLFDLLWTSPLWGAHDTARWYDFISQQQPLVQQHLLGGVFLSAWEYLDPEKMTLLSLFCACGEKRTEVLSLTALILLVYHHHQLRLLFPPLEQVWGEKKMRQRTALVAKELMLMLIAEMDARHEEEETEALSKDLRLEDMLNMEHIQKVLAVKSKYLKRSITRGLDPNLGKVNFLHSCSYLKRISHWFLPFDKNHPLFQTIMIDRDGNEKQQLLTMADAIHDCDVDKIAMLHVISKRNDMTDIITQLENGMPKLPEDALIPDKPYKYVVQNLYRFFVHSPIHRQLDDPFHDERSLLDIPEVTDSLDEAEAAEICDLLLELGRDDDVCLYTERLMATEGASAELLLFKGRALIQKNKLQAAINCLQQADMLVPDHDDVIQNLITCYRELGRWDEQLDCLYRWEKNHPEEERYRHLIPMVLVMAKRYEEALPLLYQIDYEEPDDANVCSSIARAALMTGKYDIACRYANKLVDKEDGDAWSAHLVMGHSRFLQGDWQGAARSYCAFAAAYMQEENVDQQMTLAQFDTERSFLLDHQVTESDISLMRDIVSRAIYSQNS